ncbi:MAG: hypothetical protein AVDCRST_MAG45-102, partial [uncultured Solirubrobacterales bacterium]
EGRRDRRRTGWPRSRAAPAGRRSRGHRGRPARAPRWARLPAARPGLHLGHGPVAADHAVGARGDLRRRRARPPPRGDHAPARAALPHPLGRGRSPSRLRQRPRATARGDRAVLLGRRRSPRRLPRGGATDLRGGDPGRGPPALSARARFRRAPAHHAASRRGTAAAPLRRALLPAPACARGLLLPFPVHRRRPVSRPRHLRRSGLPADRRRRLVRRGWDLLDRRGHGAPARRAVRGGRRAHRALRRPPRGRGRGARGDPRRRRAHPGRRRGLERRRALDPRAARAARARAEPDPDDVLLPAVPRHRPHLPRASPSHAHARARLPRDHRRGHARARGPAAALHLRAHPLAHRAGDGAAGRRLDLRAAAGAQPARADRLGHRGGAAARPPGVRLRALVRSRGPRRLDRRRARDDARGLSLRARGGRRQRLCRRAHAAPVGLLPPAQPRPLGRGPLLRRRGDPSGRRRAGGAARSRGHRRPDREGPCARTARRL